MSRVYIETAELSQCPYLLERESVCLAENRRQFPDAADLNDYCINEKHNECSLYRKVPIWKRFIFEQ